MAPSKVGELRYKTCFDHFACRASGQDAGKWRIVEEIRIRIGRAGHYKERPAVLDIACDTIEILSLENA